MNEPVLGVRPGHRTPMSVPGLLSQTILPSPLIKWILPARIRNKDRNDVVLVSERRVQIKETVAEGYLKDVAEKTDFGGTIVAAKVLNVAKQLDLASQIGVYNNNLPSEILVLCVDLRELVFLYCLPNPSRPSEDEFVTFRRPLPVDVSLDQRFGKSIAVDPK